MARKTSSRDRCELPAEAGAQSHDRGQCPGDNLALATRTNGVQFADISRGNFQKLRIGSAFLNMRSHI